MPTRVDLPTRFPLTPQQARAVAVVPLPAYDKDDHLTPALVQMVEGQQWLPRGRSWFGPWPDPADTSPEAEVWRKETRRGFVSRNVLGEAVRRHAGGVLGREPRFDFVSRAALGVKQELSDADKAAYGTLVAAVTAWWNRTKPHRAMKEAARHSLYMRRGVVRLYVHPGKLAQLAGASPDADGTVRVPPITTLEQALSVIAVEVVHPTQGGVTESPRDGSPVGVVYYRAPDDDGQMLHERVQWTFLTPERETLLVDLPVADDPRRSARARQPRGAQRPPSATALALGGRLLTFEFTRDPIITPTTLQQQATINFALSALPKVLADAGWLERIFGNTEPPGTWEYDESGVRKPGTFKPGAFHTGPRRTIFARGIETEVDTAHGVAQTLTNPWVSWRPPVDPEFAIKALYASYRAFLEEVHQAHVFLQQQGEASGRSHEMARADYEADLDDSASVINPVGRDLLEAAVALAEDLLDTPGRWTDRFRADFQCRFSIGRRTADEEESDNRAIQENRLSRDTTMERGGIDDVAAERARIDADPDVRVKRKKARAEVFSALVAGDLDRLTAAKIAEFTPEEIKLIEAAPEPEIEPEPGDADDPPPAEA